MEFKNVKGSFDFLPNEQKINNYIEKTLRNVFEQYGYIGIETPILCYYDLLKLKYSNDSEILNEIYKLSDQGKRELGLRYDLTVPFAKYIAINKEIKIPFKKYEIGKVFRDGPVKLGRNREFIQCDIDAVGISGQETEAELMLVFINAFKQLNIDIVIKYNNRKLMNGLILETGIENDILENVITIIDKMKKVDIEEVKKELILLNISNDKVIKLLDYFKYSFKDIKKLFSNSINQVLLDGILEVDNLNNILKSLDVLDKVSFDVSLARGQSYYTGMVFEVYAKNEIIKSSIGGGGRYDNMITDFLDNGNKYPAVGISFGLSVIYEILASKESFQNDSLYDFYIIPINTKIQSLKLAESLRCSGCKVLVELNDIKVKNALSFANKEKIPNVIILGEDEIKKGVYKVKEMFSGIEKEVYL